MTALYLGIFHNLRHIYFQSAIGWALCIALEQAWQRAPVSLTSRLQGAFYWLFCGGSFAICSSLFHGLFVRLHLTPLLSLVLMTDSLSGRIASWTVVPVLALLIDDFFFYWMHRANHRFELLWRIHGVHHAIREINAVNNNAHIGEGLVRISLVALPVALLVDPGQGPTAFIVMWLAGLHGYFSHSDTRFHLGPLCRVIVDNRFHRLHHATSAAYHHSNYGNLLSIWDQLFGTARFPAPDEWPDVGLIGQREPRRLADYVMIRRMAAPTSSARAAAAPLTTTDRRPPAAAYP